MVRIIGTQSKKNFMVEINLHCSHTQRPLIIYKYYFNIMQIDVGHFGDGWWLIFLFDWLMLILVLKCDFNFDPLTFHLKTVDMFTVRMEKCLLVCNVLIIHIYTLKHAVNTQECMTSTQLIWTSFSYYTWHIYFLILCSCCLIHAFMQVF